jgi:hypothetical protein
MRSACGGHACSRAILFCESNTTKDYSSPCTCFYILLAFTPLQPHLGRYKFNVFAPAMPLTPHTIRYEDRRVQCVGCRLCGVYFCACAKRNAPLHPRTPVPTTKLTQCLHKHRGPCIPHNAEPVRDGGGRASPLHAAYYTFAWYGMAWGAQGSHRCKYRGQHIVCA